MPRAVTIGNGNLLVGLDDRGQVRDFYYPYVGHANHVSGASGSYVHRIGVWTEGQLHWISDDSWQVTTTCSVVGAVSEITARNETFGVTLLIEDVVHNERDIFLRKIVVTNERNDARDIRVFFGQEFRISESRRGDTAFYDPRVHSVIHYKGHNAFLIHAVINGVQFDDYSIGLFGIEGKEGTYTDAEDGELSQNPIEHGSVDSVLGLTFSSQGNDSADIYYWVAAGDCIANAHALHQYVVEEKPQKLITSTEHYWKAWVEKEQKDLSPLKKDMRDLYKRSLAIIRVHTDNRGGIIASSDSGMLNQGRDTYSYVWPRDAAITANALDRAGYHDATQSFFTFMAKLLEDEGYLMHKYRSDGVLGSSWHPWVRDGVSEVPIQEDETALVVYMLWQHYQQAKDLEFMEALFNPFIEPAADFFCTYIEEDTGLPSESYDLWEEKFGTSTYTASSVYGALTAAASISKLLGKSAQETRYRKKAESLKKAILTHLFDEDKNMFVKLVRHENGGLVYDHTIDISSFHGIVTFGVLDVGDKRVKNAYKVIEETLKVPTVFTGYMRYENDQYFKTSFDAPPNAWCITTLWVAQYYIKAAKTKRDLKKAKDILQWTNDRASEGGILPEQVHPYTGAPLSATPLVWSHAEYVITIDEYLKRLEEL